MRGIQNQKWMWELLLAAVFSSFLEVSPWTRRIILPSPSPRRADGLKGFCRKYTSIPGIVKICWNIFMLPDFSIYSRYEVLCILQLTTIYRSYRAVANSFWSDFIRTYIRILLSFHKVLRYLALCECAFCMFASAFLIWSLIF